MGRSMVTRTFTTTKVKALFVDTVNKTTVESVIDLVGEIKTDEKALKVINTLNDNDNLKGVDCEIIGYTTERRGMTETDFYNNSVEIKPYK